MDFALKHEHRRMLKVSLNKPRTAIYEARADEARAFEPRQDSGTTATHTAAATTASATPVPAVVSGIPTSTAAFVGVAGFLAFVLILTAAFCFYRRRKLRRASEKHQAPSALFDQSALVEKKNPFAASVYEYPLKVDLAPHIKACSPVTPSSASSSEESGWRSPASALRVKNADSRMLLPTLPKATAEKNRASQRGKPSWITTRADEFVGSPPPSYDIASGAQHGFTIPVPSQPPPELSRATATPPTPPATQKEHRDRPSLREKAAGLQSLVVPAPEEVAPVASPARSESFAPKDLVLPPPELAASPASSEPASGSSSFKTFAAEARGPRLMTVVAPYVPTLTDELRVSVGDTVRLMLEYKDGWGFVQFVGKGDAPKGVVPMICLQERRRMVPTVHKASNGSVGSVNGSSWR